MLSTERRRHDVYVLFGDVVMTPEARIGVLIKNTLFSVTTIKIFISCNENIQIFTRASYSRKYGIRYTR